jgi:hypothetical protein
MVDLVMKMKLSINKYFQVFNRVFPGYGELAKFILIDHYVGFSGKGRNFSFIDVKFYTVNNAANLCRVNVRL